LAKSAFLNFVYLRANLYSC